MSKWPTPRSHLRQFLKNRSIILKERDKAGVHQPERLLQVIPLRLVSHPRDLLIFLLAWLQLIYGDCHQIIFVLRLLHLQVHRAWLLVGGLQSIIAWHLHRLQFVGFHLLLVRCHLRIASWRRQLHLRLGSLPVSCLQIFAWRRPLNRLAWLLSVEGPLIFQASKSRFLISRKFLIRATNVQKFL